MVRRFAEDRWFDWTVNAILVAVSLLVVVPLLYVVSVSLTPYGEVLKNGGYVFFPKGITFSAYAELLKQGRFPRALGITTAVTVIGTFLSMILTLLTAYPLSRKKLPFRNPFLFLVVFTILFSGGMIPTYLIVKETGLLNSIWAMIIPNAVSAFFVLLMKSFFQNIPEELFEQAQIDGARETRVMLQIVMPVSVPVILTISLFYAVGRWNEFLQAILYISNRELFPLQVLIREILTASQSTENIEITVPTMSLQMAAVVLATIPIVVVYPFIQKHFIKGAMLGSIKG